MSRHAWTKLSLHRYICNVCGTRKRNVPDGHSQSGDELFRATFELPDGYIVDQRPARTPACKAGPLTLARLREAGLPEPNEGR